MNSRAGTIGATGQLQSAAGQAIAPNASAPTPAVPLTSTVRASAVFALTRPLSVLPPELRLRSAEWGVLFAITGAHTVTQVGQRLGLTPSERDRAFAKLASAGLVSERELAFGEYLAAITTIGDAEPKTIAELLGQAPLRPLDAPVATATNAASVAGSLAPTGPGKPGSPPANPTLAASPSGPPPAAASTRRAGNVKPAAANGIELLAALPFEPLPSPQAPEASPSIAAGLTRDPRKDPVMSSAPRGLSLAALMRFIVELSGDDDKGQLDIYRVFVRLDPTLLRQNGISTLRFADDRIVRDPALIEQLVVAVEHTLAVALPDGVWV